MPRSRSSSFESITRSATRSLARKMPLWCSRASTSVVLPWSTWAMMAMLRRSGLAISCEAPVDARHPHQYTARPVDRCSVVRRARVPGFVESMISFAFERIVVNTPRDSRRSALATHRDRRRGPHYGRAGRPRRPGRGTARRRARRDVAQGGLGLRSAAQRADDAVLAERHADGWYETRKQIGRSSSTVTATATARCRPTCAHLGCRVHWDDGAQAVPLSVSRRRLRSRRARRRRSAAARRSSG